MEFDLTTFALEILNFLVLVWLLKHFFYQPVLAVIEKRQKATEQMISDAKSIHNEADVLKSQYEAHLAELEGEYTREKARIDEKIAVERKERLALLETEIATERKRREALEDRERREREHVLEKKAIQLASRFATRLLERLAGPELNTTLVELAISELESLSGDEKETVHVVLNDTQSNVSIASAYPLDGLHRTSFTDMLSQLAGRSLVPDFSEDSTLKAGVSIMVGSWVLMANLRDELSFFTGNLEYER
jgi:F-type H+-transporting ATPase subunit b